MYMDNRAPFMTVLCMSKFSVMTLDGGTSAVAI
jgi:hypothetical protein